MKLLRFARLVDTFESENDVSTGDLTKQLMCVVAATTRSPASADPPDECPWSNNSSEDAESFLTDHGVSSADIQIARQYLKDEINAMYPAGLMPWNEPQDHIWMPQRKYALSPMSGTLPASYFVGKNTSSHVFPVMQEEDAFKLYAELGTVQLIDYARRALNIILREDATLSSPRLDEEQKRVLQNASLMSNAAVGTQRIRMMYISGNSLFRLFVHGCDSSNEIVLLRGERGYRCATEGNVGGKPCDFRFGTPDYNRYIFRNSGGSSWGYYLASTPKGPLDDLWTIAIPIARLVGKLYVMKILKPAGMQLLGVIDGDVFDDVTSGRAMVIMPVTSGSSVDSSIQQITSREPGNCGSEAEQCGNLGMKRDFIPPLENEITDDSNQYESSWLFFLNRAKEAALFADGLGEQLVEAGLRMDERAENAQREVERICGGVSNLDPFADHSGCDESEDDCDVVSSAISSNPTLEACLPPELGGGMTNVPYVSAGSRPLCIYYDKNSGAICSGPHVGRCPQIVNSGTNCTLEGAFFDDQDPEWPSIQEAYDATVVEDTLNLFQSMDPVDVPAVGCVDEIARIRSALDPSSGFEIDDMYQVILNILTATNSSTNPFTQKKTFEYLSLMLGLEVMPLHHYAVTFGNRVLWTTFVRKPDDCPREKPWLDCTEKIGCVRPPDPDNPDPNNLDEHPEALWPLTTGDHSAWLVDEHEYFENRRQWGSRMRKLIMSIGVLAGRIPNVQVARWYCRDDYGDSPFYDGGSVYPGVLMRIHERDDMSEPGICFAESEFPPGGDVWDTYVHDQNTFTINPAIPLCHIRSDKRRHRGEWPLRYELENQNDILKINDFWKNPRLASFLSDHVPQGMVIPDDTWKMVSENGNFHGLVVESMQGCVYFSDVQSYGGSFRSNVLSNNEWRFQDVMILTGQIERDDFLELLDFACHVSAKTAGTLTQCSLDDSDEVPIPQSKDDISKLGDYLSCASNDIHRLAERMVIPNVPQVIVDNHGSDDFNMLYGQYQGANLDAVLEIDSALRDITSAKGSLSTILSDAGLELRNAVTEIKKIENHKVIKGLMIARRLVQLALDVIRMHTGLHGVWDTMTGANALSTIAQSALAGLDIAIISYEMEILDHSEDQEYIAAMLRFSTKMREIDAVLRGLRDAYGKVQAGAAKLKQNQQQASMWAAIGAGLDGDLAGRVFHVNTVMRRRMNTLRARYAEASTRARKLAFIAKRAIEFKFAVDMNNMHSDMRTVDAPASWADRICDMQGFDYERLRDASPMEEVLDPHLMENDSYEHWYIGDYVRKLEAFVESYPSDYPFTDEIDTAVISVRDDLVNARDICQVSSINMIHYSESIGMSHENKDATGNPDGAVGWVTGGCVTGDLAICTEPDPALCLGVVDRCVTKPIQDSSDEICDVDFCYGQDYEDVLFNGAEILRSGERLRDEPAWKDPGVQMVQGRTLNWSTSGYYEQIIRDVQPGDYMLTWYTKLPPEAVATVDYRVVVVDSDDAAVYDYRGTPQVDWTRHPMATETYEVIHVDVAQDLRLRVHPSYLDEDSTNNPALGDVFLWGVQLEQIYCNLGDCTSILPNAYQSTGETTTVTGEFCPDRDGDTMRSKFKRLCRCPTSANGANTQSCAPEDRVCYWEYEFEILLEDIESGNKIPSDNIAVWNFNYRLDAIAVNLVGNMVIACDPQRDPASCYTNSFVPYTLQHGGVVTIRGYDHQPIDFSMDTGRIEHAKALADGVTLWNPISSQHRSLLTDLWKDGFRGRPLQGNYKLRIFDNGKVSWEAINDIQLVVKYRYWTPASGY